MISSQARRRLLPALPILPLLMLLSEPLWGQPSQLAKPTFPGALSGGTPFYTVYVNGTAGTGIGLYTITTGPMHSLGVGKEVLYGRGQPGTSFNTVRSYTTGTDYVQIAGALPSSPNQVVSLDPFGRVALLDTPGFRTTYELPGGGITPDELTIYSDVIATSAFSGDSGVRVTVTVLNNGSHAVDIGVRLLWDLRIENDDGPTFQKFAPNSPRETTELEVAPTLSAFVASDNDIINLAPPSYNIIGTAASGRADPQAAGPDLLQFTCWANSFFTAFDYTIDPQRDIARLLFFSSACRGTAGGDSAIAYYFGSNKKQAITVPPGAQVTVSAFLVAVPPLQPSY